MPLPTTNLTLHLDASDTDKLFTTWVNGGPHTGTPADNGAVQVWSAEADGSVSPANAAYPTSGREPAYRSGTPLMLLPCLDFDGTDDELRTVNNASISDYLNSGSFLGDQAKTIIVAFYAESITSSNADPVENHSIIGGSESFVLSCKSVSGTPKVQFCNNDAGWDTIEQTIAATTTVVACARHDATNIYLSVDGGSETSAASGATSGWPNTYINIGKAGGGAVRFNGRIGEIALYNAALTGSDLTDAIAYFRLKWQGVGGSPDGEEALAGSAITPGHGTQTPGISISI
jgi:hypothetical protein